MWDRERERAGEGEGEGEGESQLPKPLPAASWNVVVKLAEAAVLNLMWIGASGVCWLLVERLLHAGRVVRGDNYQAVELNNLVAELLMLVLG